MKNRYSIPKKLMFVLVFIIFETIFLKLFIYTLLPSKYFFDSLHILGVMNGSSITDTGYTFTAKIFNFINIFNFSNIQQWGYFVSIIFLPIIIYFVLKEKKYNQNQLLFIIASISLLNIYVLGLSKDIIQFVYFLIIFLIIKSNKFKDYLKLFFISLVLLHEALNFRVYYAILAFLLVTMYFIYMIYYKKNEINKSGVKKLIFLILFMFFLEVFVVQLFSSSNYDAILNARYSVNVWRENDMNANTIINDLLGRNSNYFVFVGNYLINFIRMMFPLELILKGFKQIAFFIYQIFISYSLLKSIKKINSKNCLIVFFTISFMMVSVIFEPDFGSFVRHEASLFLFLLEIAKIGMKGVNNYE